MTRIAEYLLLQAVDRDLVLIDQKTGAEIIIPNKSIRYLASAACYFQWQLLTDPDPIPGDDDDD